VASCASGEGKSTTTIKQGQQHRKKPNNNNQPDWVRGKTQAGGRQQSTCAALPPCHLPMPNMLIVVFCFPPQVTFKQMVTPEAHASNPSFQMATPTASGHRLIVFVLAGTFVACRAKTTMPLWWHDFKASERFLKFFA